jgi:hypothetical protein
MDFQWRAVREDRSWSVPVLAPEPPGTPGLLAPLSNS